MTKLYLRLQRNVGWRR